VFAGKGDYILRWVPETVPAHEELLSITTGGHPIPVDFVHCGFNVSLLNAFWNHKFMSRKSDFYFAWPWFAGALCERCDWVLGLALFDFRTPIPVKTLTCLLC
jgi:hypothetical protein